MSDDIRCWACGRELEGKAAAVREHRTPEANSAPGPVVWDGAVCSACIHAIEDPSLALSHCAKGSDHCGHYTQRVAPKPEPTPEPDLIYLAEINGHPCGVFLPADLVEGLKNELVRDAAQSPAGIPTPKTVTDAWIREMERVIVNLKAGNDALRRQNKLMRERLKANRDAPPA